MIFLNPDLNYFGRGFPLCHEHNIPWIAELLGQFCHPSAGYANKVNMLQFWFAYMPGVFVCLAAVLTNIRFRQFHRITQMTGILLYRPTTFTYMNIISHDRFPF
jgi:hypothetical protein